MGDVALVAPVIQSVLHYHKTIRIVFVTRSAFIPFFEPHKRLTVVGVNLNKYKGLRGLYKLFRQLNKTYQPFAVCDLHNVLRTSILTLFFSLAGKKRTKLNKDRRRKKRFIKSTSLTKKEIPLKHTTKRYLEAFEKLKYPTQLTKGPWLNPTQSLSSFFEKNEITNASKIIGLAPFARHKTKIWGFEKTSKLATELVQKGYVVFLFGGGDQELNQLKLLETKKIIVASNKLTFRQEISLIAQLRFIITMDSANMHIASLVGTKVFSIWGSTHPYLGFSPLNNEHNIIQIPIEKLNCRPCSVYGNIPCSRGDHACMSQITTKNVLNKINLLNT